MLEANMTFIFTLPSEAAGRTCSGTVVALQYCFQTRQKHIDTLSTIFQLVTANSDGSNIKLFPVQTTPIADNCTNSKGNERICCAVTTLNSSSQFDVPTSAIPYGVVVEGREDHRPLAFNATSGITAQLFSSEDLVPGSDLSLSEAQRTATGLVLLRFLISMH